MSTPLAVEGLGTSGAARSGWREFIALLRLAAFLPVDGQDIAGRDSTIFLLAAFMLAAWIGVDPLLHSRDLVFHWPALPDLVCVGAGVFALAWVLQRLSRPAPAYRRVLVLTLGALPLAMVGEIASWKLVDNTLQVLLAVLSLYALVFVARGLRVLTGRHQPLALGVGVLFTAGFLFSMTYLQANPRLWVLSENRMDRLNPAGAEWPRMTRVQFAQQERIDSLVAGLAPQDSAATDVFFLGFAGYGQEKIFARDVEMAARSVGRRFGSDRRSMRLVNDRTDLETWPIATEPGLRHALRKLGEAMGDEDVLFLTLSSHGERGTGVRISSPGLVPTRLVPESLGEMLRESGIRWRVIVVSACYSGDFADELADERSIVITAAGPDRKSFGCNDSRELTYFGEAFFRDALAGGGTLREAFETARTALEKKERDGGIVPSRPQASFGALIEARLNQRN